MGSPGELRDLGSLRSPHAEPSEAHMIDTVFFDAAGTLFHVRGSVGEIYARIAARFDFEASSDAGIQERMQKSFQVALWQKGPMIFPGVSRESIEALERDWWKDVVYRTFRPLGTFPRIDECFEELYQLFRTPHGWELEPGCREVLAQLRGRGLKLGIISNFDSRLSALLAGLGIDHYFDALTLCSLVSAAKPQPEIFFQALEQIGSVADNALHVGDDFDEDFQAARATGLHALLYDPLGRFAGLETTHRIQTLAQIFFHLV